MFIALYSTTIKCEFKDYATYNGTCVKNAYVDPNYITDYYCAPVTLWPISKYDFANHTNHQLGIFYN